MAIHQPMSYVTSHYQAPTSDKSQHGYTAQQSHQSFAYPEYQLQSFDEHHDNQRLEYYPWQNVVLNSTGPVESSGYYSSYSTNLYGSGVDSNNAQPRTISENSILRRHSHFSDRHGSPWSAPEVGSPSPASVQEDSIPFVDHYGHSLMGRARTISMNDVQRHADVLQDLAAYDEYGTLIPDSHHPVTEDLVASPLPIAYQQVAPVEGYPPTPESFTETPVIRHRKSHRASLSSAKNTCRVSKRSALRRASILPSNVEQECEKENDSDQKRPFYCPLAPYGCTSTFGSKNEWKRHFSTQHLRLGFWRCDQCPVTNGRKPNDFNRKDLFVQHVRRMHGSQNKSPLGRKKHSRPTKQDDDEEVEVILAAKRCHKQLRSPPSHSSCVICQQSFSGANSWDERMEHLGRHFEDAKKETGTRSLLPNTWTVDVDAERWMIAEGILMDNEAEGIVVVDDYKC